MDNTRTGCMAKHGVNHRHGGWYDRNEITTDSTGTGYMDKTRTGFMAKHGINHRLLF